MTCPSGKIPYPSPQAAHATLQHVNRRQRTHTNRHQRRRPTGSAYRCPLCAEWHVTTQRKR